MINIYYREISKFPIINAEEEQELLILIKQGDEQARKTLIECNLRLVTNIARQYRRPNVELLDLIQEGNLALIEAVDKFDIEMEHRFSTFAVWSIRKAIQEFLGENNAIESIDSLIQDDDEELLCFSDTIADEETILGSPTYQRIDVQIERTDRQTIVNERFASLSQREKEVLMMLYGMDMKPMTLQDIANQLGVSHERVRCIRDTALKRLK